MEQVHAMGDGKYVAILEVCGFEQSTINQIRHLLRRNNLEWERPTKGFQTKRVKQWLLGSE